MKHAYVFDLDGTLSDGRHRLHLLPSPEDVGKCEAWDAFNMECDKDTPIVDNIYLCNSLFNSGFHIIILTGRSDIAYDKTVKWLSDNKVRYNELLMREQHDDRKDIYFKEEMLEYITSRSIKIMGCFDDLDHVAKHIRSLGYTCHLVTHYDNKDLSSTSKDDIIAVHGGMKYDKDKIRTDLLFNGCPNALEQIATVLTMGARKYADDSWKTVPDAERRYFAAQQRHELLRSKGEIYDSESKLSHLAHIACNALFRLELEYRRLNDGGS